MNLDNSNILEDIYNRIYLKDPNLTLNIFLCGASTETSDSIRDNIYSEIQNNPKFNIVFPEWLFASLNQRDYNLLRLEAELADYVDAIVIPLEGVGAYAEIGAFAMNDKLINKLIVINNEDYRKETSFINLGPLKLIRDKHPNNIVWYTAELDRLKNYIVNKLSRFPKNTSAKLKISNLFNLSRFLLFIIAIYQPLEKKEIVDLLVNFKQKGKIPEHLITPSIDILVHRGNITLKLVESRSQYVLTKEGHNFVYEEILPKFGIIKDFSKIRAELINKRNRKKYKFNTEKGLSKFLADIE